MIEERLRDMIVDQYGSMNEFAKATGIKYQTLVSILNRGVQNATVHNVITICQQLGISTDALADGRISPAGSGRSKELRAMLGQFKAQDWHEVADIDARAARLISLYEVDGIPENLLQDRLRVLQENRAKLSERITQIKNGPRGVDRGAVGEILGNLDKVVQNGDFDALRGILTALIDRIVVDEDDVTIFWRFSYPL